MGKREGSLALGKAQTCGEVLLKTVRPVSVLALNTSCKQVSMASYICPAVHSSFRVMQSPLWSRTAFLPKGTAYANQSIVAQTQSYRGLAWPRTANKPFKLWILLLSPRFCTIGSVLFFSPVTAMLHHL